MPDPRAGWAEQLDRLLGSAVRPDPEQLDDILGLGRGPDEIVSALTDDHLRSLTRLLLVERLRQAQRVRGVEQMLARAHEDQTRRDRELAAAVDELRRSSEDLLHAQKVELVGRLVGGIAHDFNNLLSVMVNYAHFLREALPPGPLLDDVQEISRAAERATDLTRRLLLFVRRDDDDAEVVDVCDELAQVERMLGRLLGEAVELSFDLAPVGTALVRIERSRLEQVVTNLVVNARDALPGGGCVVVTARRTPEGDDSLVELSVRDDGEGMSPEALRRAVEPFFSTKARTAGTGLGLATVASVVEQAGGRLELTSELGVGTQVRVLLPAVTEQPTRADEPMPTAASAGHGRVVLVEDDPAVLQIAQRVLLEAGFEVVGCADARQARAAVNADTRVLVTDLVLPDLRGDRLAAELRAVYVDLPVLLVTGYDESPAEGLPLLRKPFTSAGLLRAVEAVLHVDAP